MSAASPVLIDLPNATALMNAEVGVIVQSEERETSSKIKEIFDASQMCTVGLVYYDFRASISWNAVLNGTTGLAIAAPGVALTMANSFGVGTGMNGCSTGGIYVSTTKVSHQAEELRMISGTAVQRAGVL